MKPSQTARVLRYIAQAIDDSKRPDRVLVAQELRKVLAGIVHTNTPNGYLISDDEPLGLCVGFEPTADQLEVLNAEAMACVVISDDKKPSSLAYHDFNADDVGNAIIISSAALNDPNPAFLDSDENKVVVDFDLEIWRTPEELAAHIDDFLHG
jgi:hypothetical protein